MGSSSSKPARKLAKQATQTVSRQSEAAGAQAASAAMAAARAARTSPPQQPEYGQQQQQQQHAGMLGARDAREATYDPQYAPTRAGATRQQQAQASETKTADIMRDASDPQLLQNLARLGAVHVPKNSTNYEPSDQMLRILAAREKANLSPAETRQAPLPSSPEGTVSAASNRVSASTIALLLDDRKHCETRADLEKLAVEYDLPVQTIEQLARYFNSPTMGDEIREEGDHNKRDEMAPARYKALWVEPEMGEKQKAIAA